MFCPQCGRQLEDGKSFCKFCGARVSVKPEPAAEYGGSPPKGWPGWVVPLLAVIGVLILASFIALAVLLLGLSGDTPKATEPVSTDTIGTQTTLTPATVTPPDTAAGGGVLTTATIPTYDPDATKTPPTGAASEDEAAYVNALDNLEDALSRADDRVPILAVEINNTAPRVSKSVEEELGRLQQDVENAQSALGSHDPPQRFQRADELIFNAADEMLYRIEQTRQGINAMWYAGTVGAGTPYFDAGRVARDQFRTLFDQYRSTRP